MTSQVASDLGFDLCGDPSLPSIAAAQERAAALIDAPVESQLLSAVEANGRVCAEDVLSASPLPPFDHSAMDGYALGDLGGRYRVRGRLPAGASSVGARLGLGEASRIFTGAPVPFGAVAVAMQERVTRTGDEIVLMSSYEAGANIRRRGEDVASGETIVQAGSLIDARHVAIMAAAGINEISVRRKVVIGLLSTGDELLREGETLGQGRINDANRPMLRAVLARPAYDVVDLGIAPDKPQELRRLLSEASERCDAIVTSGATSVGDEDHLTAVVREAGGTLEIAKVALKPGKPVVAGRLNGVALIGLPGNPFAALVAHLLIGRVILERLSGAKSKRLQPTAAVSTFSAKGPGSRTEFAPASVVGIDGSGRPLVEKLGRGGSARLKPLIAADGLVVIPAGREQVLPGDVVGFMGFAAALEL